MLVWWRRKFFHIFLCSTARLSWTPFSDEALLRTSPIGWDEVKATFAGKLEKLRRRERKREKKIGGFLSEQDFFSSLLPISEGDEAHSSPPLSGSWNVDPLFCGTCTTSESLTDEVKAAGS